MHITVTENQLKMLSKRRFLSLKVYTLECTVTAGRYPGIATQGGRVSRSLENDSSASRAIFREMTRLRLGLPDGKLKRPDPWQALKFGPIVIIPPLKEDFF